MAIENKEHKIQIMLTNYKYEHFNFKDPANKLKL